MAREFPVLLDLPKINGGKKMFFASDFHLGAPNEQKSLEREKLIVKWLESIEDQASHIFLVGDIFDFWFEYRHLIPKGHRFFQAKIGELRDKNIPIYFFTGNHDMWMFNYFPDTFGIPILRESQVLKVGDRKILVGHGDGLGPGDHFYKFLKAFFANRLCQIAFEWLHPNLGMGLANFWSRQSRISNNGKDEKYYENDERLLTYCREVLKEQHFDYFIFGHRHLPLNLRISNHSRYFNLGEWINHQTFAAFDGENVELKSFTGRDELIIQKDYTG
jgi:UDP-2,3-diacylglucosamine hydrolase